MWSDKKRDNREDGIQKTKAASDAGGGLQRIKLWTTATPSQTEEALHSQLLMVHFLHIKRPIK